jgi:quercetin dioxygenase-like cupin family protein
MHLKKLVEQAAATPRYLSETHTPVGERRSNMTKEAASLRRTTSQISRRATVQLASVLPIALAAEAIVSRVACAQGGYEQQGPKATQLLQSDLLRQGNQVQESVVSVVEFQPRRRAPWHLHPGAQEIVYGLDGAVTLEVEGQAAKTIKAGDVALTPADVPHSVRNDDANITARILVVHSRADKQKPMLVAVKR